MCSSRHGRSGAGLRFADDCPMRFIGKFF
jgi:hypothetical protein